MFYEEKFAPADLTNCILHSQGRVKLAPGMAASRPGMAAASSARPSPHPTRPPSASRPVSVMMSRSKCCGGSLFINVIHVGISGSRSKQKTHPNTINDCRTSSFGSSLGRKVLLWHAAPDLGFGSKKFFGKHKF